LPRPSGNTRRSAQGSLLTLPSPGPGAIARPFAVPHLHDDAGVTPASLSDSQPGSIVLGLCRRVAWLPETAATGLGDSNGSEPGPRLGLDSSPHLSDEPTSWPGTTRPRWSRPGASLSDSLFRHLVRTATLPRPGGTSARRNQLPGWARRIRRNPRHGSSTTATRPTYRGRPGGQGCWVIARRVPRSGAGGRLAGPARARAARRGGGPGLAPTLLQRLADTLQLQVAVVLLGDVELLN
jgi:hypothetical protein